MVTMEYNLKCIFMMNKTNDPDFVFLAESWGGSKASWWKSGGTFVLLETCVPERFSPSSNKRVGTKGCSLGMKEESKAIWKLAVNESVSW